MGKATNKTTSRMMSSCVGDLIFVRPTGPGDWMGSLVARATDGPYCHVQIRISHFEVIEALGRGICRDTLASEPDPADVARVGGSLPLERMATAMNWLLNQVNDRYGVFDIVADALQLALPKALGSRTPFLVAPSSYDCSHLAATFISGTGYPLPLDLIADLPRVSPNALARALGVLK